MGDVPNTDASQEYIEALKIARELVDAGIPVFSAPPNPSQPGAYYLPRGWDKITTAESPAYIDQWKPGWALAAIGGHTADFLDIDPRHGGRESEKELRLQGQFPRSFGEQETPSGGTHHLISPTGERKSTQFMPGLDLQSGAADGRGRAFVFIAPTMRLSKAPETLGELRTYRWVVPPNLEYLSEFRGSDDSQDGLLARVAAAKERAPISAERPTLDPASPFVQASQLWTRGPREFTQAEAEEYCTPALMALRNAKVGSINDICNVAAATLSHFVPTFWSVDQAYAVLLDHLSHTEYDGATWTADRFIKVLDGTDPPADDWKAVRKPEPLGLDQAIEHVQPDAVDALLAEMRSPSQVVQSPPPRPLIKGLLNLDSESWMIGAPGSKKSFVALDMAGCVAAGIPWQGRRTHQGRVVIIVAEGAGGLGPRLKAWQTQHGQAMSDDVFILPRPVQARDTASWAVLVEACRRIQPALVIADTQARVTVGLEENSATEMGVYVEAVRAIREATGACVLTVHHTGRQGGDARGSSAIDGAQHSELKVDVAAGALIGKLLSEKQKDMELAEPIDLIFAVHTVGVDEEGQDVTSLALTNPNVFALQASQVSVPPETGQEVRVPEPGEWEMFLCDHNTAENTRRILTVLRYTAGVTGATKSECERIVRGRWYDGKPLKAHRAGHLDPAVWTRSWTRAIELRTASGDAVVVQIEGTQRYIVHPDCLPDSP